MNARRTAAALCVTAALLGCGKLNDRKTVKVVITPEIAGTGIADMLADRFTRESQVDVSILVTEDRFVPAILAKGQAQVVMTTSDTLLRSLENDDVVRLKNRFAFDDYLIMGPKRDPAGVKDAADAADAFRRIAQRDRTFCSPVDVPDLHEREAQLWAAAKIAPSANRRYRPCNGSAAEVLREANRRQAYTITDRAAYRQVRGLDITPLMQRKPRLSNDYTVILIVLKRAHRNAEWFVQWVMSFRGRESIEAYRYQNDRQLFVLER